MIMTKLADWTLRCIVGWCMAQPQQFVAAHGWPGLAALVAGGVFLVKLIRTGARPWIEIPVLALVALAAWYFWPERELPVPIPPRIPRHGGTERERVPREPARLKGRGNATKHGKDSGRRTATTPRSGVDYGDLIAKGKQWRAAPRQRYGAGAMAVDQMSQRYMQMQRMAVHARHRPRGSSRHRMNPGRTGRGARRGMRHGIGGFAGFKDSEASVSKMLSLPEGISAVRSAEPDRPVRPLRHHSDAVGLYVSSPMIPGRSQGGPHQEGQS